MNEPVVKKTKLLALLAGDVCPVCDKPKAQFQWTCSDCYKPHQSSPEHHRLSDICDEHMRAADAFLRLAKTAKTS